MTLSTHQNVWKSTHTTGIFARFRPHRTVRFLSRCSSRSAIGSMVRCTNRHSFITWRNGLSSVHRTILRALVRGRFCRNSLPCYCKFLRSRCKCSPRNTTSSWRSSILAKRISTLSAQPTATQRVSSRAYYRQAALHS